MNEEKIAWIIEFANMHFIFLSIAGIIGVWAAYLQDFEFLLLDTILFVLIIVASFLIMSKRQKKFSQEDNDE